MSRIVVKIGTRVLSRDDGTLDEAFLAHIVEQIIELRKKGTQVVLVTSGAVGAGKSLIRIPDAKSDVVQKQVYAAVGQVKLMTVYSALFGTHGFHTAQVLATKEDFRDDEHYANMQNCFEGLLLDKVIPIVNENDVVATTELLFTDNDELAGLVAEQLKAHSLIILTGTDGILDNGGKTIPEVNASNADTVLGYITAQTSSAGRGGMASKFSVARSLSKKGIQVSIVDGKKENVLLSLYEGAPVGTRFV